MTLGEKLKELRIEKNLKQDAIAKDIGTDNRTISLYENNKMSPSIDVIAKLAKVFNISIDYLLIDDYPKRPLFLKDNTIVDKFQYFELLSKQERESIFLVVEGFAFKNKIQNAFDVVVKPNPEFSKIISKSSPLLHKRNTFFNINISRNFAKITYNKI